MDDKQSLSEGCDCSNFVMKVLNKLIDTLLKSHPDSNFTDYDAYIRIVLIILLAGQEAGRPIPFILKDALDLADIPTHVEVFEVSEKETVN